MVWKIVQRKTRRGWEVRKGLKVMAGAAALSLAGASYLSGQTSDTGVAADGTSSSAHQVGAPGARQPQTSPAAADGPKDVAGDHHFDIPAGELTVALEAFGRVTHLNVRSKIPADKLTGFRTAGVRGQFPDEQALRILLDKTGLDGSFDGSRAVEISIRNAEHVDVTTSLAVVGLQQFSQPLLDTAQTVNVVPQFILSEQADTTLRDSLRNVPGISIAAGEGGSQGDNLTIRGFSARNDIFLDGIRDFGSYYRDSFNYESIDVLEGPASVEFGRGSTGGVVNQESKVPELRHFTTADVQLGSDAMRRGTLDFDQPMPAVPGGTAVRVNLVGEEAGVAGRDVTETRRYGIAPSISFGLETATRFTLAYLHEREDSIPDYGLPYFGTAVAAVPRTTYYGIGAANHLRTTPDVLTARLDHDFGLHLNLRNNFRWGNYPRDARITEPLINTAATLPTSVKLGAPILVQCAIASTPAASCYTATTPLSQVYVKRNQITVLSTEDILWDQLSATAHFRVAHVANSAMVLLEGGRERSNPNRPAYTLPYVPALNPNPDDAFAPSSTIAGVTTHVASQSFGVDFLDTMELTHWLELSGGIRFDYFSTTANTPANTATTPVTAALHTERLDKQPTYRAAVVVKPRPAGSLYFDWGTSFNPAAESLSLSANNATSPPEYNQTFEAGAKWTFLRDRLNLNGSLFRTEKLNAREVDPTNSLNTINSGNQLVRGLQIGALGHLPSSFDLIAGYAFLDGRVESSILNASPFAAINNLLLAAHDPRANTSPYFLNPAGFPLANVPRNSGNLWVTHRLPFRFVGGFGGNYVGARRASSSSLIGIYTSTAAIDPALVPLAAKAVPGYTLLNAMLQRPIGERIHLQVNVNNLTNAFFIDEPHPSHLIPGEGLNAQFGVNYRF